MLAAILKEMELVGGGEHLETIYFGGGTPSLLSEDHISSILNTIVRLYKVDEDAEITLEANPDDVTTDKLKAWKALGINRLSIGVQSFFEEDLQWMHRAHNETQARVGLEQARNHFDNITIDLIYGTPGLTNEKWKANIQTAVDMDIPHLSCYALTVEPQTPLDKLVRKQKKENVNPEHQANQFLLLMDWMDYQGYEHYEISNFAKPGKQSRHNSSYWKSIPYTGFGPSAHSFTGAERRWNVANNQKYMDAIARGALPYEKEILTHTQKINELILTALRTIGGIDVNKFTRAEQERLLRLAQKYTAENLLSFEKGKLKLTRRGTLYADGIAADLFFEEEPELDQK